MDFKVAFYTLNIDETKDERIIREAYHSLLKTTNPEDDQEGFKKIREAYEVALRYARTDDNEKEEHPKTDIDVYMQKIEKQYSDLALRFDVDGWKELLSDPICDNLDTSMEVRTRMLDFLCQHFRLTQEVVRVIDNKFEYISDIENLKEEYHIDFLNYLKSRVVDKEYFKYDELRYIVKDKTKADPDAYLGNIFQIMKEIDYLEVKENNRQEELHKCRTKLDELKAYGVYHVQEDVERLRIANYTDDNDEMVKGVAELESMIDEDNYVAIHVGEAVYKLGDKERAVSIWRGVLEKEPNFYRAKYNIVSHLYKIKDFYHAHDEIEELFEISYEDQRALDMLKEITDGMLTILKEKIEKGEEDEKYPGYEKILEYAWCLLQNGKPDEALILFEENPLPDDKYEYRHNNLLGRALYQSNRYNEALPYIEKWKDLLWEMKEDGTKLTRQRLASRHYVCDILADIYFKLGDREKIEQQVEDAIAVTDNIAEKLQSKYRYAMMYSSWKEYEKCVDICDQILKEDNYFYPAVVLHQEACYELKKAQEVVNDYHRAVQIYKDYYKPYLLAAEVYFYFNQYNDSMNVLKEAEENEVELSPKMLLIKAKNIRNLAENKEDRMPAFAILDELAKKCSQEENDTNKWDIEDNSDIVYQKGLLYWDSKDMAKAEECFLQVIAENKDKGLYRHVYADFLADNRRYEDAIRYYRVCESEYKNYSSLLYGYAVCYEGLGKKDKAIEYYEMILQQRKIYRDSCEKLSDLYLGKYKEVYDKTFIDKAIECMNRQIEETPNCYYYVHRGLIYLDTYMFDKAIDDFNTALTYIEDDWASYNNIGCCYERMGEFTKAIECFEKAIECMNNRGEKDALSYSNMADCFEALGQYEKAIECYETILAKVEPNRTVFYKDIASLYEKLGDHQKARDYYMKCKDKYEGGEMYTKLAYTWLTQGAIDNAVKCCKKGIDEAKRRNKKYLSKRLRDLGLMYLDDLGELQKSIKYLKKALIASQNSFDSFEATRHLAIAYFLMGNKSQATYYAQRAVGYFEEYEGVSTEEYLSYDEYKPLRTSIWAWIELCLGNQNKAMNLFEDIDNHYRCRMCRYSKCYEKDLYLGDVYAALGDLEKARKYYEEALVIAPDCHEAKLKLERIKTGKIYNKKKFIFF